MIEGNEVTATFDVVAVGLQVRTNVEVVDPELCVCACVHKERNVGVLLLLQAMKAKIRDQRSGSRRFIMCTKPSCASMCMKHV